MFRAHFGESPERTDGRTEERDRRLLLLLLYVQRERGEIGGQGIALKRNVAMREERGNLGDERVIFDGNPWSGKGGLLPLARRE